MVAACARPGLAARRAPGSAGSPALAARARARDRARGARRCRRRRSTSGSLRGARGRGGRRRRSSSWPPARRSPGALAPPLARARGRRWSLARPRPIARGARARRAARSRSSTSVRATRRSSSRAGTRCSSTAGRRTGRSSQRLRRLGVRRLDVLVGTHAQADHIGGADRVAAGAAGRARCSTAATAIRERRATSWRARPRRRGAPHRPGAGRAAHQRSARRPARGALAAAARRPPVAGADPNERAIVLRVTGGGVRLLLTADAESDVLAPLDPGRVDVLKVSHHGSADAGLPRAAASACARGSRSSRSGRGNTYGHPTPATLAALRPRRRARRCAPTATAPSSSTSARRPHARPHPLLDWRRCPLQARLPDPRRRPRARRRAPRAPARARGERVRRRAASRCFEGDDGHARRPSRSR